MVRFPVRSTLWFKTLSLAWLLGSVAIAQTYNLKGRVLDKVGMKPVVGALIEIPGMGLKTNTDADGRFNLQGATGIAGAFQGILAAPYFRDGMLYVQAARTGEVASVELFGLSGQSLSSRAYPLARTGWNRLQVLPAPELHGSVPHGSDGNGGGFSGFARITVSGRSWVKRLLTLNGPNGSTSLQWTGDMESRTVHSARALAKAASGTLDVTADRLVKKSVAFAADNADLGDIVLDYPARKLDVGAPPIYGAVTLFDGSKGKTAAQAELSTKWKDWTPAVPAAELAKYTAAKNTFKIAKDPQYPGDTARVTLQSCCNTLWGYDDVQEIATHGDVQIHVEFTGMGEFDATENPNGSDAIDESPVKPGYYNSGVYIQSRYEMQIRAFTQDKNTIPGTHDMGAIVDDYSPSANVNRPHGQWQAYDITFRSARYDNTGKKLENARISMWWNGVQVHNNREAHGTATGLDPSKHSGEELTPTLYGLKLQSEGRDVRFRNIWVKDLDIADAQTNFGY